MSRIMRREVFHIADGAFAGGLAPPAGHKYEIIQLTILNENDLGTWVVVSTVGAAVRPIFQRTSTGPEGQFEVDVVNYNGVLLYPGEYLLAYQANGPPSGNDLWIEYIDVDT